MHAFYTPAKNRSLVVIAVTVTLLSPVIVFVHYFVRMARGDYPWNADAIAIPIFSYWIMVFPFGLLFLVFGLRRYTADVFLLAWNPRRLGRSIGWTFVSLFPLGATTVGMILDGINGRLWGVAAFFVLHLVLILILRASIVMYSPPAAQPGSAPNGGPATSVENSDSSGGGRHR